MLLLLLLVGSSFAEPTCPKYSTAFDFQPCDPRLRSQCPGGFTCRRSNDSVNPQKELYLCCDNSVMDVTDWFSEANLVPQVFPQMPLASMRSVQLTPVYPGTAFPDVHIGDEVVVLSEENQNYTEGRVVRVTFDSPPPPQGGFLHFLTVVDPGYRPTAIFFTYNVPSLGVPMLMIGPETTPYQVTYIDRTTTVPRRASYRAQYATLAFRTLQPVGMNNTSQMFGFAAPIDAATLMEGCSDVACLLTNTTIGRQLEQPQAGTLFYLTTRKAMYSVDPNSPENSTPTCSVVPAILLALLALSL